MRNKRHFLATLRDVRNGEFGEPSRCQSCFELHPLLWDCQANPWHFVKVQLAEMDRPADHIVRVTVYEGEHYQARCSCGWFEQNTVDGIMKRIREHFDQVTKEIFNG